MSFLLLFASVSWILMLPYPSDAEEWDRELYFPDYYFYAERRLINHTIKTMSVKSLDDCEYLCYMEGACVSLNIKNKDPVNGTHECELNNSTHMEHDGDLVDSPIYYYRGAKNNCVKNGQPLCENNATCQSGFTYKKYRCSCTPGFTGEHCENDIDECAKSTPLCDDNAVCNNTHGAYNCTCKPRYTGDGFNCTDIDNCGSNSCLNGGSCIDGVDGYKCNCPAGVTGEKCENVDVCHSYHTLTSEKRSLTYTVDTSDYPCDYDLKPGWYRFQGNAGTQMATECPIVKACGAVFPGWLKGTLPVEGNVKRMEVCFRRGYGGCNQCQKELYVEVKNCGTYYIYNLIGELLTSCQYRFCGMTSV